MNDEIIFNGMKNIMGINIPVIKIEDNKKVILSNHIAAIHGIRMNDVQDLILQNYDEFELGIDFIDLCDDNFKSLNPILKNLILIFSIAIDKNTVSYYLQVDI